MRSQLSNLIKSEVCCLVKSGDWQACISSGSIACNVQTKRKCSVFYFQIEISIMIFGQLPIHNGYPHVELFGLDVCDGYNGCVREYALL